METVKKKLSQIEMLTDDEMKIYFRLCELNEQLQKEVGETNTSAGQDWRTLEAEIDQAFARIASKELTEKISRVSTQALNINVVELDTEPKSEHVLFMQAFFENVKRVEIYDDSVMQKMEKGEVRRNCRRIFELADEIFLGENITEIPEKTFWFYENLKKVEGGENVGTIGSLAFYGCKKLESFGCRHAYDIGEEAFRGCQALKDKQLEFLGGKLKIDNANGHFDEPFGDDFASEASDENSSQTDKENHTDLCQHEYSRRLSLSSNKLTGTDTELCIIDFNEETPQQKTKKGKDSFIFALLTESETSILEKKDRESEQSEEYEEFEEFEESSEDNADWEINRREADDTSDLRTKSAFTEICDFNTIKNNIFGENNTFTKKTKRQRRTTFEITGDKV